MILEKSVVMHVLMQSSYYNNIVMIRKFESIQLLHVATAGYGKTFGVETLCCS